MTQGCCCPFLFIINAGHCWSACVSPKLLNEEHRVSLDVGRALPNTFVSTANQGRSRLVEGRRIRAGYRSKFLLWFYFEERKEKQKHTSFPKMLQAEMFMLLVPVSEFFYFYSLFVISDDLIATAWGTISLILKQRPIFGQRDHTLTQKTVCISLCRSFHKRILLTCHHRHLGWESVANSATHGSVLAPVRFSERM